MENPHLRQYLGLFQVIVFRRIATQTTEQLENQTFAKRPATPSQ